MQYLINSKVILSNDGLRTPGTSEAEVRLTKVPLRLLYVLAENPNTSLSRSHIFYRVWEEHGQEASGASLTVHLSNLRKQLGAFGIEPDAIKVLPSREIYFTALVEPLPEEASENPALPHAKEPFTRTSRPAWREKLKISPVRTLNIKKLAAGIILLILTGVAVISLFSGRVFSDRTAEQPVSYAGWELAGQIKNCNYYFLKDYLVRSFNVEKKIEDFITENDITCVPSDMILVSVHDRNASEERRTEPERDFEAYCHKVEGGFACESYYYYNGK